MHRSGPVRCRILPILVAGVGLFAAAGCAATPIPEAPPIAQVAVGEPAVEKGSGALSPVAPAAQPAARSRADLPPFERMMAIIDDTRLPRSATSIDPLLARSRQPRQEWLKHPGAAQAAGGVRRHVATLQFGRGSAALAREEYAILRAVAALRAGKGGSIQVIGHADRGGARGAAAQRLNQLISERRAAAVADALVALGQPSGAIAAEGRGDLEPRYAENDAVGMAGNRRAEIYLVSSEPPPAAPEQGSRAGAESILAHEGEATGAWALERQADEPAVPEPEKNVFENRVGAVDPPSAAVSAAGDPPTRRVPVATLYFGHASSRLGERERAIIEAAAAFQRQSHGALVIVGHASAAGAPQQDPERLERANRALSLARADAVARRLAARGVSGENLSVLGKGSDEPAFAENDTAAEAGNRRVEIYVDVPAAVRLADRGQGLSR